ncbi:MAG: FadR family transcriptional regulator [Methylobacterium mesophilicum]|nr:FadR family transcriptional regulator [Methylobacterium mesophilicum]
MHPSLPSLLPEDLLATDRPRTHHGHVMRDLGRDIVGGRFAENSVLPGDGELMERFGVSRTVLREALKTLAAKGLIQARARIGTRVRERQFWNLFDPDILYWHAETGVDERFLLSLGEMRLALEPEAAALAAKRRSEEQCAALYAWIERMAQSSSSREFVESDLGLHMGVAEASGNPFMLSVSTLIEVALATTFSVSSPIPDPERHAGNVARHRAIVDAIARADAGSAREAMRTVIREGMDRVKVVADQASGGATRQR